MFLLFVLIFALPNCQITTGDISGDLSEETAEEEPADAEELQDALGLDAEEAEFLSSLGADFDIPGDELISILKEFGDEGEDFDVVGFSTAFVEAAGCAENDAVCQNEVVIGFSGIIRGKIIFVTIAIRYSGQPV